MVNISCVTGARLGASAARARARRRLCVYWLARFFSCYYRSHLVRHRESRPHHEATQQGVIGLLFILKSIVLRKKVLQISLKGQTWSLNLCISREAKLDPDDSTRQRASSKGSIICSPAPVGCRFFAWFNQVKRTYHFAISALEKLFLKVDRSHYLELQCYIL